MYKQHCWYRIIPVLAVLTILSLFLVSCQSPKKEQNLTANGTIEATEVKVVAEVGGMLKKLAVKEGDRVQAGQVIGQLDETNYRILVEQAGAGVAGARAALDEARAGAREQEIEASRREVDRLAAQVAGAQEQVTLQEDNLKRARELFQAGALPEQELVIREVQSNTARYQLEGALAQFEAARARLNLLRAGSRKQTIERLDAAVNQSEGNLKLAQLNLQKTRLIAPAGGMVAGCNFKEGELIRPGAEVVTLLNDHNLWLHVYVPENRLGRVKIGQPVQIQVDTHPGKTFPGQVEYISPRAEFTPRNVQTAEDRVNLVFRVKIRITGGQKELRPGLPADVTFITATP